MGTPQGVMTNECWKRFQ